MISTNNFQPQVNTSGPSVSSDALRSDRFQRPDSNAPDVQSSSEVAPSAADNFDVGGLVDQIWGFASNRIAQAKADGASEEDLESLWQAAERGVEQGFGEAKEILDELGKLDEPLKLKIDSAYGQLMDRLEDRELTNDTELSNRIIQPEQSKVSNRFIGIQQYERQTFELNLQTQQGDRILIRSVSESSSSIQDLQFGSLSSTRWSSAQSSGYELIIQGDLNDQEREDLDNLLADVNELAEEFYQGDYQTAFEKAQNLSIDGTSLQSLDLSMSEVEQKAASAYSEMAGLPSTLPKGLAPLKEYAEKLVASQEKWAERFDAPRGLLQAMENHPLNNGKFADIANQLLG